MQLNFAIRLVICLTTILGAYSSFAQTVKNQKVFNLHAGSSLVGGAINLIIGSGV